MYGGKSYIKVYINVDDDMRDEEKGFLWVTNSLLIIKVIPGYEGIVSEVQWMYNQVSIVGG